MTENKFCPCSLACDFDDRKHFESYLSVFHFVRERDIGTHRSVTSLECEVHVRLDKQRLPNERNDPGDIVYVRLAMAEFQSMMRKSKILISRAFCT